MPTLQNTKQLCRLCCYETTDTIGIFSEKGLELDYKRKINKYLYLKVSHTDNQPKTICWMCSDTIGTFHRFFEKINEIQQNNLKDNYEHFVLHPIYDDHEHLNTKTETENESQQILAISNYKNDTYSQNAAEDGGNDVVEVLLFDSTSNDQDETLMHAETETQHIVVAKTEEEINDNDNVETYVIYENQHTTTSTTTTNSCTDDLLLDGSDIITMEVSNFTDNNNEILTASEEDEIIPIPISDNEDFEKIENVTEIKIKTKTKRKFKRNTGGELESIVKIKRRCSKRRKSAKNWESIKHENDLVNVNDEQNDNNLESHSKSMVKGRKKRPALMREIHRDIPMHVLEEGDSGNEFPARDEDNDDWPAQQTLDEFPKFIIDENGQLLVKGKKLMTLICKFYKLSCEVCGDSKIRFRQLNDLFAHYTQVHKSIGYITCCQTKLSRYPTIIMHMARHIQPDAFRCNICGYMVTRPRFLESHRQTHLPEDQKPYGCDKCGRRFCWKGALQIHMISHQPANERKQYTCHLCGKIYDTPGGLSTHKKNVHIERHKRSQTNVCHLCAKSFATRTNLHEHMSTIHQPREKGQQQCGECGKWLMNMRCLKSHMILHSDVELRCDICDYVTKKQHLLKRHLLTQHSDAKPFKCDLCKKSFKIKRALTVHISQHNNSKTYKCTFCERVFNSSTNFYTHRKQMHPAELHALTEKKLEIQRQKRIRVGRENGRIIDAFNLDLDDEDELLNENTVGSFTEQQFIIDNGHDANDNDGNENEKNIPINANIIENSQRTELYEMQTAQNVIEQRQTTFIDNGTIFTTTNC